MLRCGLANNDTKPDEDTDDDPWPTWPIVSATKIAMALCLTSDDLQTAHLLQQRRGNNYSPPDLLPDNTSDAAAPKIEVSPDYSSRPYLDPKTGELTSCIRRRDDHHLALNDRQLELLLARDQIRDSPTENSTIQTLTSSGQLCAKIPTTAQARDLILSFQQTNAFNVGLLVRDTRTGSSHGRL